MREISARRASSEGTRRRPARRWRSSRTLPAAHFCIATVYEAQHIAAGQPARGVSARGKGRLPQRDRVEETSPTSTSRRATRSSDRNALTMSCLASRRIRSCGSASWSCSGNRSGSSRPSASSTRGSPRIEDQRLLDFRQRVLHRRRAVALRVDASWNRSRRLQQAADSTVLKARSGPRSSSRTRRSSSFFSRAAVRHFPKSAAFWKALGSAYDSRAKRTLPSGRISSP